MAIDEAAHHRKLAQETGVKVVTIRYYEQIGLMPVAPAHGRKLPDV